MANIKLGNLYLSKEKSKDIIELLAKREILKTIKANQAIDYIISLKNNLKKNKSRRYKRRIKKPKI